MAKRNHLNRWSRWLRRCQSEIPQHREGVRSWIEEPHVGGSSPFRPERLGLADVVVGNLDIVSTARIRHHEQDVRGIGVRLLVRNGLVRDVDDYTDGVGGLSRCGYKQTCQQHHNCEKQAGKCTHLTTSWQID